MSRTYEDEDVIQCCKCGEIYEGEDIPVSYGTRTGWDFNWRHPTESELEDQAEYDGWHVAGRETLCDRCAKEEFGEPEEEE